mgnify:CR=1 FL=1
MIKRISHCFVTWMNLNSSVDEQELALYGSEILLHTFLAQRILLGAAFGRIKEAICIIAVFYIMQSIGGGYHANSHLRCFLVMSLGLMIGFLFCNIITNSCLLWTVAGVSFSALLLCPIKLNKNKEYMRNQIHQLMRRSYIVILTVCILLILVYLSKAEVFSSLVYGVFASAVSRIAA